MISGFKLFILLLISISTLSSMTACSEQPPAQPSCRVNASAVSNHQGVAACIVSVNGKLLVTQLESGLYDLPIIKNISSTSSGSKSAQCAAHQSMWLQTGLNVEVQNVVGAQADGTWLFGCKLSSGFDGSEAPFDPPHWSSDNVKKIMFINPFDIELYNWAQRDHFDIMRDAYILQGNYQKAE